MPIGWIGYILYVLYCNVQVYMAQPTWPKTAALLRILVAEYLQEFQNLYPRASFLPEMVYFVHLPDQVVLYRPLRHHWCMHFETKNRFIKLRKWWQLVNIWLSVARYHQIYMIYRQIGCLDELLQNYLYSGNIFYEGKLALTTVFHPASLCRFHMQLVRHFLLDKLCFKPWFTAQSGLQLSLAMCLIMFHLLVLCGTYLLMRMCE